MTARLVQTFMGEWDLNEKSKLCATCAVTVAAWSLWRAVFESIKAAFLISEISTGNS